MQIHLINHNVHVCWNFICFFSSFAAYRESTLQLLSFPNNEVDDSGRCYLIFYKQLQKHILILKQIESLMMKTEGFHLAEKIVDDLVLGVC